MPELFAQGPRSVAVNIGVVFNWLANFIVGQLFPPLQVRTPVSFLKTIGPISLDLKDRHQWWGREFRCSLSLNMVKLFSKAIINVLYHKIANDAPYILI